MEILSNQYVQALIILLIVTGVAVFAKYVYPKLKSKGIEIDADELKEIYEAVSFVSEKLGYKQSKEVTDIVGYVFEALEFAKQVENVNDMSTLAGLVIDKTKAIIESKGISINDELERIVIEIVNYAIDKW